MLKQSPNLLKIAEVEKSEVVMEVPKAAPPQIMELPVKRSGGAAE